MLTHFSISQQGQRHIDRNAPCQDYSASRRVRLERFRCEVVIAAVADGLGSCDYSQFGSETAVCSFVKCVEINMVNKIADMSDASILKLLEHAFHYALCEVEKTADERMLPFMEFDSTLTGIVFDGQNLWFGHIGDDGAVVLYTDGTYEMITKRHKGEEAHSLFPLRETGLWQFGKAEKAVASLVLMTDGVLDHCVDSEAMGNRVYYPFLEPALTEAIRTDEEAEVHRLDWDEYLSGKGDYAKNFREMVTDDISLVVVQNPEAVEKLPEIQFDAVKWDEDTERRKKEMDEALYEDYRAYKAGTYRGRTKPAEGYARRKADKTPPVDQKDEEPAASAGPHRPVAPGDARNALFVEAGDGDDCFKRPEILDEFGAGVFEAFKGVLETAHSAGKQMRKQIFTKKDKTAQPDKPSKRRERRGAPKHTGPALSQPPEPSGDLPDKEETVDAKERPNG